MLFQAGIEIRSVTVDVELSATGYCYGGFRHFPEFPVPILDRARTALLVRDPRDALVSLYYSMRDSHPLPKPDGQLKQQMLATRAAAKRQTIDAWAIENHGNVIRAMEGYVAQRFTSRPNVAVYRYEDVIFRKREWIRDLVGWYGWDVRDAVIERIAVGVDVFPAAADPGKHIRQVNPGNHRTALRPATQNALTEQFEPLLRMFGYDLERVAEPRKFWSWRRP